MPKTQQTLQRYKYIKNNITHYNCLGKQTSALRNTHLKLHVSQMRHKLQDSAFTSLSHKAHSDQTLRQKKRTHQNTKTSHCTHKTKHKRQTHYRCQYISEQTNYYKQ